MDAPDLYSLFFRLSLCLCPHPQHIFLFSPHPPTFLCPPNLARYTLLGRIDRPFTSYALYGAFNSLNPYV
jgi:hypothetical protein